MAIQPLQLPPLINVPQVDMSGLGQLGDIYRQGEMRRKREALLANMPADGSPQSLMAIGAQLAKAGDIQGATALAQLGQGLASAELDRTYKLGTLGIAHQQANRKETPAGFREKPGGGGLEPIPGGPQDPAYLHSASEAKDKGKKFNAGEIGKLTEEGGKYQSITGFTNTFQDRFGGYGQSTFGNANMTAGRFLPEAVVGKDRAEGATWWQQYDRHKNQVRNDLFGSALTATEQAAFERADINPGMTPKQIRTNLEEQQRIVKAGMLRKASALVASGYEPEPIAAAYGLKVEDLGVTRKRAPGPAAAPAAVQPGQPVALPPVEVRPAAPKLPAGVTPQQALTEARAALQRGAPREAVIQRLQQMGLDTSGL